jgi:DNA polymerase-3 subunit epsilon
MNKINSSGGGDTGDGEHVQPSDEVRILRRIAPLDKWPITNAIGATGPIVAVVDTETSGLDPETDAVIEIAAALVRTDAQGRITSIADKAYGLQDPGRPLPAKIKQLTGLNDERLAGRAIDIDKMTEFLARAEALLAHGARFDAGFCRRLLPGIAHLPWVCTLNDIDWLGHGFDGRALGHLLMQQGLFAPRAHTAGDDVTASINLAATVLPNGRTVLAEALANAQTNSVRVDAEGPTYGARAELKRRCYSFDGQRKSWWIETSEFQADYEHSWINQNFPQIRVSRTPITWFNRHC